MSHQRIRAVLPYLINEGVDEELASAENHAVQQLWHPSWHTPLSHGLAPNGAETPTRAERAAGV